VPLSIAASVRVNRPRLHRQHQLRRQLHVRPGQFREARLELRGPDLLAGGRGCHAGCANGGMTRTDNKALFRTRSGARSVVSHERARGMRSSLTPSEELLCARLREQLWAMFRRQVPLLARYMGSVDRFRTPSRRPIPSWRRSFAHLERVRPAVPHHFSRCAERRRSWRTRRRGLARFGSLMFV
jgi:hypothetical protein